MKKVIIPIFTEEYKIVVVVGSEEELAKYITRNCDGWSHDKALNQAQGARGGAFDRLNHGSYPRHPVITINGDMPYREMLATLPHEASHCADYLFEYLGMTDESGEIRGHIISAVVRCTLNKLLGKKELIAK